LTFTASADHATTISYEARLYASGTSTPLLDALNLGKPTPDEFDECAVDISSWLNSQDDGFYEVRVAAVNVSGSNESTESNTFTVPLEAE
jgi:hypothetical protein